MFVVVQSEPSGKVHYSGLLSFTELVFSFSRSVKKTRGRYIFQSQMWVVAGTLIIAIHADPETLD